MRAPPTVLVVEDNSELRHVLKEALGSEGYQVIATRDELDALEILRGTHIDLLISDLTDPPNVDETLQTVRREFPDLPVVALSEGPGSHPTFFFAGWRNPDGYVTLGKPFRLGELLALSREVLSPPHGVRPTR